MPKNPNNEYSKDALRKQIDVALANLPVQANDETVDWETRREWALKQLRHTLELYTGTTSVMIDDDRVQQSLTPSQREENAIYFFLEHEWSLSTGKRPIFEDFIERAIGKQP